MKKFIILLLILLPITITSCRTTKIENEIVLKPHPQRQELLIPKNTKECAQVILYYHSIIKQWEAWGDYVEGVLKNDKVPEVILRNQED